MKWQVTRTTAQQDRYLCQCLECHVQKMPHCSSHPAGYATKSWQVTTLYAGQQRFPRRCGTVVLEVGDNGTAFIFASDEQLKQQLRSTSTQTSRPCQCCITSSSLFSSPIPCTGWRKNGANGPSYLIANILKTP